MGAGETAASGAHAIFEGSESILSVFIEYVIPLVFLLVGFFAGSLIGGVNAVYNAIIKAAPSSTSYAGRIAGAVIGAIGLCIGGAMWALRSRGGMLLMALGGALGGFAFGYAGWGFMQVLNPQAVSSGFIDNMVGSIAGAAGAAGSVPGAG